MKKMKIEIRSANQMIVQGYVNAVGRDSRVLSDIRHGRFVEQVMPKTFERAIARAPNVELRFNHDRLLGSVKSGDLQLHEDNIGLYAKATISDPEIIAHAKKGELRGWSFQFVDKKSDWEETPNSIPRRKLEDIELREVSILTKTPAYVGTSIEVRGEETEIIELRNTEDVQDRIPEPSIPLKKQRIEFLKLKGRNKC